MATAYYFDRTSGSAGFGTLTGNWTGLTSSTYSWIASNTGTGTNIDWPTAATDNIATFGGPVTTAIGGTATVSGTINLGAITVQSLVTTTTQTITGGTLNFGSVTGAISAGAVGAGALTINSAITGTNGITITGTSAVTINSVLSGLSGTITCNTSGLTIFVPQTTGANVFNSATTNTLVATNLPLFLQQAGVTAFTVNANLTGNQVNQQNNTGTQFTMTVNGTMNGLTTYKLFNGGATIAKDLPGSVLLFSPGTTAGAFGKFTLNLAADTTFSTAIQLISEVGAGTGTRYGYLESSSTGAVNITGALNRVDSSADAFVFQLGGTNTGSNTISGTATRTGSTANVALVKADLGKWVLGGDNSAIATSTTINANSGTLGVSNANALGTTADSVTLNTGSVLEISGSITLAKAIISSGTIRNASGDNILSGAITLGAASKIDSASGTLTVSGVIGGASALTFGTASTGTSTVVLSNSANSFSTSPTIAAGTVQVASLANSSSNSPLGSGSSLTMSGTSTLKVSGGTSLASTNRALTLTSATATLDSSNTLSVFPVALLGAITPSGTSAITLAGSNTGYNQIAGTFGASDSLTKSGASRWILTGANSLGGSGTVSAGTIMAANDVGATGSKLLGSTVAVAAGAKIQLGSDGTQKGCNTYTSLAFNGTLGNPARIRIGGSAVSPTVYLSGDLTLPTGSDKANWDLSADVFKTPNAPGESYTLFVFAPTKGLSGSGTVTSNVTATGLSSGRSAAFSYNTPGGGPNTITVTIS